MLSKMMDDRDSFDDGDLLSEEVGEHIYDMYHSLLLKQLPSHRESMQADDRFMELDQHTFLTVQGTHAI